MKEEDKILEKYGRDSGMRTPEGYFDDCFSQISASLPPYPDNTATERLTKWQRLKPYIYMAAMFAGIWLMMKVFYHVGGMSRLDLDNPPQEVALAMAEYDADETLQFGNATITDIQQLDEVGMEYDDIEDFEKDFGYKLKPQYDNINVSAMI